MYKVAVKRAFSAHHYLIGGDWGPENNPHGHDYMVEVQLEGRELDRHGYLVDIVDIEEKLDRLVEFYRGRTLNDLNRFEGLNPSIERFSRIFCEQFSESIDAPNIQSITVVLWESDIAWASFRMER